MGPEDQPSSGTKNDPEAHRPRCKGYLYESLTEATRSTSSWPSTEEQTVWLED
jgi:hypothetical protein